MSDELGTMVEEVEDQCEDCPGRTMKEPFGCCIPPELKQIIGRHSGLKNQMEIIVTKCHHKERVIADAPRKRKMLDELRERTETEGEIGNEFRHG